jgi:hypothetical protein
MNLIGSKMRLAALTKDLTLKWAQTREHWNDAKSTEFEKKYLEELVASVDSALGTIDQLDKIITKIRTDCE